MSDSGTTTTRADEFQDFKDIQLVQQLFVSRPGTPLTAPAKPRGPPTRKRTPTRTSAPLSGTRAKRTKTEFRNVATHLLMRGTAPATATTAEETPRPMVTVRASAPTLHSLLGTGAGDETPAPAQPPKIEMVVRTLDEAYKAREPSAGTHTAKSEPQLVDDDLQMALALSASLYAETCAVDPTPVLELDMTTGLLKYPAKRAASRNTMVLATDLAKRAAAEEAFELLAASSRHSPAYTRRRTHMAASTLTWRDPTLALWNLSREYRDDGAHTPLTTAFIHHSPLLAVLSAHLAHAHPDTRGALQAQIQHISTELTALLHQTLAWAQDMNIKLSTTPIIDSPADRKAACESPSSSDSAGG